jgi:hypothetical protein
VCAARDCIEETGSEKDIINDSAMKDVLRAVWVDMTRLQVELKKGKAA